MITACVIEWAPPVMDARQPRRGKKAQSEGTRQVSFQGSKPSDENEPRLCIAPVCCSEKFGSMFT